MARHTHQTVQLVVDPSEVGKLQESELMERMPNGEGADLVGDETSHVRLVSLGNHCGPKLSFKHLGRGAETLPFDWSRTRLKGVLHYMRNDFAEFFHFDHSEPVPGLPKMTMYRSRLHSFWHDNPTDEGMREKYTRRFERFKEIDARSQPVLFVRVAAMRSEVEALPELLDELLGRFGPKVYLFCIFTTQDKLSGPIAIKGLDSLLVYHMPRGALQGKGYTVYAEPVACALHWLVGRPSETVQTLGSIAALAEATNEIPSGLEGLGGLRAFESDPEDEAVLQAIAAAAPAPATAASAPALAFGLRVASLGHFCGLRMALESLGVAGQQSMPFDWINSRISGVLRLLRSDLTDLLATDGLERLEYDTGIEGQAKGKALRGRDVAFWYQSPLDEAAAEEYRQAIGHFRALDASAAPLLFVRVAAVASEEVVPAAEVLAELRRLCGRNVSFLLILDNQRTANGAGIIENEENLMLYYLNRQHVVKTGDLASTYGEAVRSAMAWATGQPFPAMRIPDLATAATFVDEDCTGLCGLGGFQAYLD